MAGEQGKRWHLEIPSDDINYKSEVLEEAEFMLPEGFIVKKWLDAPYITDGKSEWELVTNEDLSVSIVGDRIIRLERA